MSACPGSERSKSEKCSLTLENWPSSASAGAMPKFSHICVVSAGHELPAKIKVLRILWVEVMRRTKEKGVGCLLVAFFDLGPPLPQKKTTVPP